MTSSAADSQEPQKGEGSLAQQVYRSLKEDILTSRVGRDELLQEQSLAERYHVSKTPVREALRLLVHEGLLLVLPRKGYMVRPVGLQDVVEIFALRRILEPPLAMEAARRRTPEQIVLMEQSVERERGLLDPSLDEMEVSLGLHMLIAEATGNTRAVGIMRALMDDASRMPWIAFPAIGPDPNRPGVEEHAGIVAAIAAGDDETAGRLMTEHLETTIGRVLGRLAAA
jgi:DNA-binding GntR family transcriptional regulator